MKQTLKQIEAEKGISRFTLAQACKRGAFPCELVLQKVGSYYEVDPETPEFQQWREKGNKGKKRVSKQS